METYDVSQASRFMQLLARREAELGALLTTSAAATLDAGEAAPREVADFKDLATQDMLATVDEAQAEHAEEELQQVLAARQRLLDDSFGLCLDCGKSIDLHRLNVLPAAPRCTACQSLQEKVFRSHAGNEYGEICRAATRPPATCTTSLEDRA